MYSVLSPETWGPQEGELSLIRGLLIRVGVACLEYWEEESVERERRRWLGICRWGVAGAFTGCSD